MTLKVDHPEAEALSKWQQSESEVDSDDNNDVDVDTVLSPFGIGDEM